MSRTQRKSAAALLYDAQNDAAAPRVVAKGYGLVAEMIVQRAKEAGLYVHEAPEMVSLLMQVDLDARIPPKLYQAVAELLAWLHRLESGVDDRAAAEAGSVANGAAAGGGSGGPGGPGAGPSTPLLGGPPPGGFPRLPGS
ncbi:EscU/YscU/HrcU family type III secretion system export apparatus switch protein [Paraburkholderia kururiensis]|uniref:EscU/YscU/HrcU family type III secretion system export apparatus switch protein n=1 Tax=Paraburkholderia kururiensis TaxID=984307 RepID=UPI000345B909|nr:EscU/YscU/HrcU family type III secretion system export apparatus switch protein [Paraburkholderia kururiensis]